MLGPKYMFLTQQNTDFLSNKKIIDQFSWDLIRTTQFHQKMKLETFSQGICINLHQNITLYQNVRTFEFFFEKKRINSLINDRTRSIPEYYIHQKTNSGSNLTTA